MEAAQGGSRRLQSAAYSAAAFEEKMSLKWFEVPKSNGGPSVIRLCYRYEWTTRCNVTNVVSIRDRIVTGHCENRVLDADADTMAIVAMQSVDITTHARGERRTNKIAIF